MRYARSFLRVAALSCGVLCVATARGQGLPLPSLPTAALPEVLGMPLGHTLDDISRVSPVDVRELRIRDLLRRHREVLERDPRGAPLVRSEILALAPSTAAREGARQAGFTALRRPENDTEDGLLVVLRAPDGMSTRRALALLRKLDPAGTYDFNHLYLGVGTTTAITGEVGAVDPAAARTTTRIGLIDSGIDTRHPLLAGSAIQHWGCEGRTLPSAHGTAVASLLAGNGAKFRGAAPGATLFAADVYCDAATGGALDGIVAALLWMGRERVPVVNLSLVGPPNAILERIVMRLEAQGVALVAAVGNDGPAAPALYPASYPGVIAVTAVDTQGRLLPEAGRAAHIDFAAPGADMLAAVSPAALGQVRGTSFAAPLVAGLLAREMSAPDAAQRTAAIDRLAATAIDLGTAGPDRRYGKGLVGATLRVAPRPEKSSRPPE